MTDIYPFSGSIKSLATLDPGGDALDLPDAGKQTSQPARTVQDFLFPAAAPEVRQP